MENAASMEGAVILVADDNPNNLKLVEDMLSKFGCEVRVALNGQNAVYSVLADLPDLILMDIHMPEMDGYSACEAIKKDPRSEHIPIIFVSAMDENFNRLKAFECGGVDYVTKPIVLEELKARIAVHLKLAQQRVELMKQADELKEINQSMLGREVEIMHLMKEVNDLSVSLGVPPPYKDVFL